MSGKKALRMQTKFIIRKRLVFWIGLRSRGLFCSLSLWRDRDVKLNCSSALTRMTHSEPQTFSSLASSCWKNLFSSPQPCTRNVTPTTRHHLNVIQLQVSHILPQLPFLPYPCHLFPTIWCFRLNGATEDTSTVSQSLKSPFCFVSFFIKLRFHVPTF